MLKKGPTSGTVVPTAVSSTHATGYLPQSAGNAAASLSPAITNSTSHTIRTSPTKSGENDGITSQPPTEKVGENRPPHDGPSQQDDIIADLQQRMLRDAEARGVLGPDWQ
jgi:hypothetical protein